MRTGTITTRDAYKMAVKVGKQMIDKGESNGQKITIDEVRDIFQHSIPRKFRPIITDDEKEFQKYCDKYGMSEQQAEGVKKFAAAIYMPKTNSKGYFIYVEKDKFNNSSTQLGSDIGHELFHTLSMGKTVKGKKRLKELQAVMKKQHKLESGSNETSKSLDVQSALVSAIKFEDLLQQKPEAIELYGQLQTENRWFAYMRTALRTVIDPRLKKGEQKIISEKHLPMEKLINPNSIAIRPTIEDIDFLQLQLKEEAKAYSVSSELNHYGYKLPSDSITYAQMVAANYARAHRLLEGEKQILAKTSSV